jgi:hypothetical protein
VWFINNLHIPIHNMVTLFCKIYIYIYIYVCVCVCIVVTILNIYPEMLHHLKFWTDVYQNEAPTELNFLSLKSDKFQISTQMQNKWVGNTFRESLHLLHMKHVLKNINSTWVKRNPTHGCLFKERLISLLLVKIITVIYNSYNFHFFPQPPVLHWGYRSNFMYAYINLQ